MLPKLNASLKLTIITTTSAISLLITPAVFCVEFNSKPSIPPRGSEGYFFGAHGGVAFPNKFTHFLKNGYSAGGQYGYRDANFRTALSLGYLQNKFSVPTTATYNLFTTMINFYYDFNYTGIFVPFVGAGVGYLHAWLKGCSDAHIGCTRLANGNKLAYQGMAGIGLQISRIRFDVQYRYFTFTNGHRFSESVVEGLFNIFV